jgi:hypothetical protein
MKVRDHLTTAASIHACSPVAHDRGACSEAIQRLTNVSIAKDWIRENESRGRAAASGKLVAHRDKATPLRRDKSDGGEKSDNRRAHVDCLRSVVWFSQVNGIGFQCWSQIQMGVSWLIIVRNVQIFIQVPTIEQNAQSLVKEQVAPVEGPLPALNTNVLRVEHKFLLIILVMLFNPMACGALQTAHGSGLLSLESRYGTGNEDSPASTMIG